MDENKKLVDLLYKDPDAFLENRQSMVNGYVLKFVGTGLLKDSQKDDVVQYINERLLTGVLEKMQKQYNPSFNLKTYFSKIVCNLCLQYAKKENQRDILQKNVDFARVQFATDETTSAEVALKEIFEHLRTVFTLYGERRPRLELLLKITLKMGITEEDILAYHPGCDVAVIQSFLENFENPEMYCSSSLTSVYETIIPLLNALEGKDNTADSLRKWVDSKLDEIAEILNVPPINAALTRETAKLLLEKYYHEFPKIK